MSSDNEEQYLKVFLSIPSNKGIDTDTNLLQLLKVYPLIEHKTGKSTVSSSVHILNCNPPEKEIHSGAYILFNELHPENAHCEITDSKFTKLCYS